MLSILGIQMHVGGCAVASLQWPKLMVSNMFFFKTWKSSQFDKNVISFCEHILLSSVLISKAIWCSGRSPFLLGISDSIGTIIHKSMLKTTKILKRKLNLKHHLF